MNIYAPPESNREFFKSLFDTIAVEAEGVCICGGDLSVIMDFDLDTTSFKRNKKSISKLVKNGLGGNVLFLIVMTQQHTLFTPELTISLCKKNIGI